MKKTFTKIWLLLFALVWCMPASAQKWQQLNPGAGGRVQGVSCDPTTPGRMFVASDMEGFYYSDNYGTSWNWAAKNIPTTFVLMATGRGNNFFVGHAKGLSVSHNKGASYSHPAVASNKTIGFIEVDPSNTNNVYAGINWRANDGHLRHYPQETTDTQEIYYSHDGGNTWDKSSWSGFAQGDPRVQTIAVDPSNSNDVLIGTASGLQRSSNKGVSWTKMDGPTGIDIEYCWGVDFTKDGNWIYAIYRKGGMSNLFVKSYPNGTWKDLGNGDWGSLNMWDPKVFQTTGTEHNVLISQHDQSSNKGLFEGRFTVDGSDVTGSYSLILDHNGTTDNVNYDIGWNYYVAQCRSNTYYPANWSDSGYTRGVFTMVQQSYFTGDAAKGNKDWRVVSTGYVKSQSGLDFYRSRGTSSTFTYDVAGYQNYLIQGQADNLALESWDNGGSWVQARTNYNVQDGHAVHVIPHTTPIVLMDAATGWGGGNPAASSNLLYKNLDVNSPNHSWQRLAYNADLKGLPNSRIWEFHADPDDYKRLYVLTHSGLYLCDNIVSLIQTGSPYFRRIHESTQMGSELAFNPANTDEIYFKSNSGSFKGVRNGSGEYDWAQMTRSTGQDNNLHWGGLAVVNKGGNKYVYGYERQKGIVRADNGATQFNEVAVLRDEDLFNYLDQPTWYDPSHSIIQSNTIFADGDQLYIPFHTWESTRWGYGILKGTVGNDGNVDWENWTEDCYFSTTKQVKKINGKIMLATMGAGVYARKIDGSDADPLPPIDENGNQPPVKNWYNVYTDDASTGGLQWSGLGDVTVSNSSNKAIEGSNSKYVEGLGQSVAPGADHVLVIDFDPLDVQNGVLSFSLFGSGGDLKSLNVKLMDDAGGYVDYPNQVAAGNSWTTMSLAISGGSLNTASFSKILIERWGSGVSTMYVDRIQIDADAVIPENSTNVPVSSVSISGCNSGTDLEVGATRNLNETVLPTNASNKSVTWSSSNTSVATVSNAGLVTAVAAGSATITVTTVNSSKTATCAITVVAPPSGCSATGTILLEKYDGISGTTISALTSASIFPGSPSSTSSLTSFEAPANVEDNYGIRVRGFICAPETGSYTFWIAGDDAVELWLSTNSTESNKSKIASHTAWTSSQQWNKYASQKSASISLQAGESYYVEALMKEGGGGDNLAVGWRKPSDGSGASPVEVIPGSVLSPASGGPVTIPVSSVSISGCNSETDLAVGATRNLNETVSPTNATNKSVTWSSSNTSVATVSNAGLVTAVAAGSATITVTTVSGSKTATCTITVNAPVTGKAIPGKIEVEDYNTGGQGVGYNDLTSGNSGGSYRTDDVDVQVMRRGRLQRRLD